jgi:hypothetical protein
LTSPGAFAQPVGPGVRINRIAPLGAAGRVMKDIGAAAHLTAALE